MRVGTSVDRRRPGGQYSSLFDCRSVPLIVRHLSCQSLESKRAPGQGFRPKFAITGGTILQNRTSMLARACMETCQLALGDEGQRRSRRVARMACTERLMPQTNAACAGACNWGAPIAGCSISRIQSVQHCSKSRTLLHLRWCKSPTCLPCSAGRRGQITARITRWRRCTAWPARYLPR